MPKKKNIRFFVFLSQINTLLKEILSVSSKKPTGEIIALTAAIFLTAASCSSLMHIMTVQSPQMIFFCLRWFFSGFTCGNMDVDEEKQQQVPACRLG